MYILYIMYFCIQKELLGRKLVNIAEFRTVAKSLPLLRKKVHKKLILSYSTEFSGILMQKLDFACAEY